MSSPPCWCTEQNRKKSFGNLTLLIGKTWAPFAIVHNHGRLITQLKTVYIAKCKNRNRVINFDSPLKTAPTIMIN